MNCIIIDDEPLALKIVNSYCTDVGFVNVLGVYTNPIDAFEILNSGQVDLVFSDIEMPQISGIDFIKSLEKKPLFIFTTAYPQYALDGFELNAIDYLVKPIPFARFLKAINRAKEMLLLNPLKRDNNLVPAIGHNDNEDEFIFVKSEYENIKIKLDSIKYIQGLKDYLKIHVETNKPVLTLMNFKDIQSKLPESYFLRIHRSFVVNINRIHSVQKSKVIIDDVRIPIGESYKDDFLKRIGL